MYYNEKLIIDIIKKYYPKEIEIKINNVPLKFFKKEAKEHFLGIDIILNSDKEFLIYFFKSDNLNDVDQFYEDFNKGDIAFQINDLKTLEIILSANDSVDY